MRERKSDAISPSTTTSPQSRSDPRTSSTSSPTWSTGTGSATLAVQDRAPAVAREGLPLPFREREPVGDREQHDRAPAQAAVTRRHLDVLALRALALAAGLPVRDAVALAVDRGRWDRRRLAQAFHPLGHLAAEVAARRALEPARPGRRPRHVGERAAQRDHLAHALGHLLGQLARE